MGTIYHDGRFINKQHVLYLLYGTLFLLPFHPYVFYGMLVPCLLGWGYLVSKSKNALKVPPYWQFGAVFLVGAFLSAFVSRNMMFSLANWALQPLLYGGLYVAVYSLLDTEREKKEAMYVLLVGAVCCMIYGFVQYANTEGMAQDLMEQSWVDPERFPLLRRRMYSTLENPNLFGGYLLMVLSFLTAFFLHERERKKKYLFGALIVLFLVCLALTYSRGAWLSVGAIVLGITLFYDKRFGVLFLFVPVMLFFYHGQIAERFLSLFSGEDTSVGLRFALWESTEAMIEENPLFGVGWASYYLSYPEYNFFIQDQDVLIFHAHNMYLNMLAEVGIPAGLSYLAFFFAQGIIGYKVYKKANSPFLKALGLSGILMVMAMATIGMGDHVLFSRCLSFLFWAFAALEAGGLREES